MRTMILTALIGAGSSLAAMNAQASLISTDGGLGVYDTTNDVTWTSDANLFATQAAAYSGGSTAFVAAVIADSGGVIHDTPNSFDPSGTYTLSASDFNTSTGLVDYWGARAWVNYLNATHYGGSNQWALPTTVDAPSSYAFPPAQSSSQLAQLFFGGLGEVANSFFPTTHNANYSLFSNLQAYRYWSGTEYSADFPDVFGAWSFGDVYGAQGRSFKDSDNYVLAVSAGQVSAVPLPGTAWLLGGGLLGLAGLARRKAEDSSLRLLE